jgi:hypothetical protein
LSSEVTMQSLQQILSAVEYTIMGGLALLFGFVVLLTIFKMRSLKIWLHSEQSISHSLIQKAQAHPHLVPEALEKVLQVHLSHERRQIEKSVAWIGTIGANAPFVGLAGTVLGILAAFQAMATQSGAGSAELMAAISRSLIATAMGLGVAIPAVICYNTLRQSIHKGVEEAQDQIQLLVAQALQSGAEAWQKSEQERHHWHKEQWSAVSSQFESKESRDF